MRQAPRFFRDFLLILFFLGLGALMQSCGGSCIGAGDDKTEDFHVVVEGLPPDFVEDDYTTYWSSAGFYVLESDTPKLDVHGSVNLCGENVEGIQSYADAQVIWDEDQKGFFTGISVNKNDVISMKYIAKEYNISDCNAPPAGVYVHDVEACKNGFYVNMQYFPSYLGRTIAASVSAYDVPSDPSDNVSYAYESDEWVREGSALIIPEFYVYETTDGVEVMDFFPPMTSEEEEAVEQLGESIGEKEALKKFRCEGFYDSDNVFWRLEEYKVSSYELNKFCGGIYTFDEIDCTDWNGGGQGGGHVENKSFSILNDACVQSIDMSESEEELPGGGEIVGSISIPVVKNVYLTRLHGLIVNQEGKILYEFPNSNSDPEFHRRDKYQYHMNMGYPYVMEEAGDVYLRITSENVKHRGGYKVRVQRECTAVDSLYVYIHKDENPPNMIPGEEGSFLVPLPKITDEVVEDILLNVFNEPTEGWVFFGIKDNGDTYKNNTGKYDIYTRVPKQTSKKVSSIIAFVEDPMVEIIYGIEKEDGTREGGIVNLIYHRIITSPDFQAFVYSILALMTAFYFGFAFMGMTQITGASVVLFAVKFSILLEMIQPTSWEYFNSHLFSLFTVGMKEAIAIMTTPPGQELNLDWTFVFFDEALGRFLEIDTWLKLVSYLFAGPMGWLYFILIIWGSYSLLMAFLGAVLVYFSTIVVVGIMLSVAPMFIIAVAFRFTGRIFQSFMKVLLNSLFQAVIVLFGIAFLVTVAVAILDNIFGVGMCSRCIAYADIASNVMPFCFMNGPLPDPFSNDVPIEARIMAADAGTQGYNMGLPKGIGEMLSYTIICNLMILFLSVGAEISSSITGVFSGTIGGAHGIAQGAGETIKYFFGRDKASMRQRAQMKAAAAQQGTADKTQVRRGGTPADAPKKPGGDAGGSSGSGSGVGGASDVVGGSRQTPTAPPAELGAGGGGGPSVGSVTGGGTGGGADVVSGIDAGQAPGEQTDAVSHLPSSDAAGDQDSGVGVFESADASKPNEASAPAPAPSKAGEAMKTKDATAEAMREAKGSNDGAGIHAADQGADAGGPAATSGRGSSSIRDDDGGSGSSGNEGTPKVRR